MQVSLREWSGSKYRSLIHLEPRLQKTISIGRNLRLRLTLSIHPSCSGDETVAKFSVCGFVELQLNCCGITRRVPGAPLSRQLRGAFIFEHKSSSPDFWTDYPYFDRRKICSGTSGFVSGQEVIEGRARQRPPEEPHH